MTEQSDLEKLCERYGVETGCVYGVEGEIPQGWRRGECHAWTVTVKWPGDDERTLTVPFFQGLAHDSEPTAADVLSCLVMDADVIEYEGFEDWAGNFGYDTDSRKAEKIYRSCLEQAPKVQEFLGEHYEEFRNAEH